MLKDGHLAVERRAAKVLEEFLSSIPCIRLHKIHREMKIGASNVRADIVANLTYAERPLKLAIEVKSSGQPKVVRNAAHQVKRYVQEAAPDAIPMVMAPYLSEQAQGVCRDEQVAYLDFMGNTRLSFDTVYVERRVEGRPEPERRALRSLFKPKSARILRAMLRDPARHWRMVELAAETEVSLGLVSTVGTALRERDWAEQSHDGLYLTDPECLLDAWAQDYEAPRGEEVRLYTHLHGKALTDKLRNLTRSDGRVALASYSAAEWLAPYARHGTSYFYADELGLGSLQTVLGLSVPPRGANIVIRVPDDDGVLLDAMPVAESLIATSPVQTYLDLMHAGERGEEAAQHLRQTLLKW
jgi:hypothetical protein